MTCLTSLPQQQRLGPLWMQTCSNHCCMLTADESVAAVAALLVVRLATAAKLRLFSMLLCLQLWLVVQPPMGLLQCLRCSWECQQVLLKDRQQPREATYLPGGNRRPRLCSNSSKQAMACLSSLSLARGGKVRFRVMAALHRCLQRLQGLSQAMML